MPGRPTSPATAMVGPTGGMTMRSPSARLQIRLRPGGVHHPVEIDGGAPAVAFEGDATQRAGLLDAPCQGQSVEHGGEAAHAIDAGCHRLAQHGNGDLTHAADRDIRIGVEYSAAATARSRSLADFSECAPRSGNRRQVGNHQAAFAVDARAQRAGHLSLERDHELVADAQPVIVCDGAVLQFAARGNDGAEDIIAILRQRGPGAARIIVLEPRARQRRRPQTGKRNLLLPTPHLVERRRQRLVGIDGNIRSRRHGSADR